MVATPDDSQYTGLRTRCVGVDRSPTTYCWLDGCPLGETSFISSCILYIAKGGCIRPSVVRIWLALGFHPAGVNQLQLLSLAELSTACSLCFHVANLMMECLWWYVELLLLLMMISFGYMVTLLCIFIGWMFSSLNLLFYKCSIVKHG